jgi:twitching motility protein PilT
VSDMTATPQTAGQYRPPVGAPVPAVYATPSPVVAQPAAAPRAAADGVAVQSKAEVVAGFTKLMNELATEGVSDVHFVGGSTAWPVKYGRPVNSNVSITDRDLLNWAEAFAKSKGGAAELQSGKRGSVECMAIIGPVGAQSRLRMAFRRQSTGYGMSLRIVSETPPALTDKVFHYNPVPQVLVDMTLNFPSGLILFCGPTGSGKTTMNAALINEVNQQQNKHIYTIEDPIEFIHKSFMSIVTQREVGEHTQAFALALKDSLRSRPNIILVGELLDLETVRVAVEAANKGHLVFATSHASSAEEAISSLVSQFPGSEQNQVSTAVAQALKAVVVQRLVPTKDGRIVPARELLLNNIAVSSKIREQTYNQITQLMNPRDGMYRFEDDLVWLWALGYIDEETCYKYCNDTPTMEGKLAYAKSNMDDVALGRHHEGPRVS